MCLICFRASEGFSLGLERAGMHTVAFCEIDPFCRKVLKKHWPDVPVYEDIRTLTADDITEPVDVICGGFPCQPFSSAARGRKLGVDDSRHLWPEMQRLIKELRPTWIIGENVDEYADMALEIVAADLGNLGYGWWAAIIPAIAVDAPHLRERLWIVGNSNSDSQSIGPFHDEALRLPELGDPVEWPDYEGVMGVGDGIPGELDAIRALGNAVVPQIPEMIGRAILQTASGEEAA